MSARHQTRTDIDLHVMAGTTRPLWLRPRRQRDRARRLIASLGLIAVMAACTLVLLALPLIAVP